MSWNYRLVKREGLIEIHEVYYDKNDTPTMCTVNGVGIAGETMEELISDLGHYLSAFNKPILNYEDF